MSDQMNIEGDSETINSKLQPPTIGEKSDNNSTAGQKLIDLVVNNQRESIEIQENYQQEMEMSSLQSKTKPVIDENPLIKGLKNLSMNAD